MGRTTWFLLVRSVMAGFHLTGRLLMMGEDTQYGQSNTKWERQAERSGHDLEWWKRLVQMAISQIMIAFLGCGWKGNVMLLLGKALTRDHIAICIASRNQGVALSGQDSETQSRSYCYLHQSLPRTLATVIVHPRFSGVIVRSSLVRTTMHWHIMTAARFKMHPISLL